MKIISWNVNGLRACISKGFIDFINFANADIICLQEVKMHEFQMKYDFDEYFLYWNSAFRKGYSGTLVLSKIKPIRIFKGISGQEDTEGRVITLEYSDFYIVNCYSPQSQRGLNRLEYRIMFDKNLRKYLVNLQNNKAVVLCGDLNVAHEDIDLKNPKMNIGNAGFTKEEREQLSELLIKGFIDTYRFLYPDREGAYTWWSYRRGVREKNIGWRIDYIIVSEKLGENVVDASIYSEIKGSDHCPIGLEITINV